MDPRGTPERIVSAHRPDEIPNLLRHTGAAWLTAADLPRPEETKAFPVPSDDGFGFHHEQGRSPLAPHAAQPNPEDSISRRQREPLRRGPAQNSELLSQSEVLQPQFDRGFAAGGKRAEDGRTGPIGKKSTLTERPSV